MTQERHWPLPTRRHCITRTEEFEGNKVHVPIGYDPSTNEICEVFAAGPKIGSAAQSLLTDSCIERSRAIQDGQAPSYFAGNASRDHNNEPTSLSGFVADVLLTEMYE